MLAGVAPDYVVFWIFAPISVLSAGAMLLQRNAIHSALLLVVNFFTLAVFFLVLGSPFLWFMVKLFGMLFLYIWIRATLPRFRYDRLMNFGWKVLIPTGLVWILFTGIVIVLPDLYGKGPFLRWAAVGVAAAFTVTLLLPMLRPRRATEGARG